MKKVLGVLVSLLVGAAMATAAEQTWHGTISDSMCGASHKSAIEHAGKKLTDRECAQACIKEGAKYVFVSGGKLMGLDGDTGAVIYSGTDTCQGVRQWTSAIAVKGRIVVGGDGKLCSWSPH